MKETALTLPLEVVESLIRTCRRLHVGNLKPHDREMLAIAEREVAQVKGDGGALLRFRGTLIPQLPN